MQLHSLLENRMIPGLNSVNPYIWKRALVKSTKLFRWVQSMKGEGHKMHRRYLHFFSKQGRKILRSILGSSIKEDARKGVKMGVYQGICSLQASLLLPFLHYCPDSPQQQKERSKLNISISELSLSSCLPQDSPREQICLGKHSHRKQILPKIALLRAAHTGSLWIGSSCWPTGQFQGSE